MTDQEINKIGERILVSWLRSNGYFDVFKAPSSIYIGADGSLRRVLMQVKTSQYPKPNSFSPAEITLIKERALVQQREAWGALLQIDGFGNLVGNISWLNFSKH